jgi:hypothetical protein
VLFVRYEELLDDLEGGLREIVAFCGFDIAPERWPTILERCRFEFMKRHESQFDPVMGAFWEREVSGKAFLRNGRTGDWRGQLSPEQATRFDRVFEKHLGSAGIDLSADLSPVHAGRGSEPSEARRPALVFHPPELDG